MKESILNKINNSDYKFTDEEIEFIKQDDELSNICIDLLIDKEEFYNTSTLELLNYFVFGNGSATYEISKEELKQIGYHFLLFFVKQNTYHYTVGGFSSYYEMFKFNQEDRAKGDKLIEDYYRTVDKKIEIICNSEEDINELYDFFINIGREDLIKYIKFPNNVEFTINDKLLKKLDKYNFEKYGVPNFLIYVSNATKYFKYFSLEDLCARACKAEELHNRNFNLENEDLSKLIYDRINEIPSLIGKSLDFMPKKISTQVKELTYKKGSFKYAEELLNENVLSYDQLREDLKSVIRNFDNLPLESFPEISLQNSYLILDQELIELMVDKGYVAPLIESDLLVEDDVKKIIEMLKSKGNNYDVLINNLNTIMNDNIISLPSELFRYLLDNNLIPEKVNVKKINKNKDLLNEIILNHKEIEVTFRQYIYHSDDDLLEAVYKAQRYDIFDDIFYSFNFEKLMDKCIENDDKKIANMAINKLSSKMLQEIFKNDKYFDYFINDDELCKKFFNTILNAEMYIKLIGDKEFNKFENYIVNNYQLNREHLDILKKKYGIGVVKYLENENIKNIINLDDASFKKLIELIPNENNFNKQDFNGVYVSLCDEKFSIDHPEIIDMFSSIINALNTEDNDKLNRLLILLNIGIDDKIVENINEKYNLKFNDKRELILSLNKGLLDNRTRIVNTDILHDVVDLYILKERKNYFEYHYFDEHIGYDDLHQTFLDQLRDGKPFDANIFDSLYFLCEDALLLDSELSDKIMKLKDRLTSDNVTYEDIELYNTIYTKAHNILCKMKDLSYDNLIIQEFGLKYNFIMPKVDTAVIKDILLHINDYEVIDMINLKKSSLNNLLFETLKPLIKDLTEEKLQKIINVVGHNAEDKNIDGKEIGIVRRTLKTIVDDTYPKGQLFYRGERYSQVDHINRLDKFGKLDRVPVFSSGVDHYGLLSKINVELVKETLTDEKNYYLLKKLVVGKKLTSLPKELSSMINSTGISSDYTNLAYFINYFNPIMIREGKKAKIKNREFNPSSLSVVDMLQEADLFSSSSSVFSFILGQEDSKLIKENPEPNRATRETTKDERLIKAVSYTINNYKREKVTVPSFSKIYKTSSDKELEVTLGNFTNSNSLTLGERTGACMRINGVGESLFDFCLTNENGFHITLENPNTHELVSRVSGFRNGNTIFLNELRYSLDKDYSNEDLIHILKNFSNDIIELSKDSEKPIDNVVVSGEYACEKVKSFVHLGIESVKTGLPYFWTDVGTGGKAILLASSKPPELVPIELGVDNLPLYDVCPSKTIYIEDEKEIIARIKRVDSIKQLLSGKSYEDIEVIDITTPISYGYINDSFYVCVDMEGNIITDCINNSKKVEELYKKCLTDVKEKLLGMGKENTHGSK